MIKSLHIKNFQSHKDTKLNFSNGVNVIVGDPSNGKTAIKRALEKLVFNKPSGARFFSNFAGKKGSTFIELETENNTVSINVPITTTKKDERKAKPTEWTLNGNTFQSGNKIPDQINNAININSLNIQNQFDLPFLVTSSAGEIAKTINRITKLENVDIWQSELTRTVNSLNSEIKVRNEDATQDELDLIKLDGIEKIGLLIDSVTKLENEISNFHKQKRDIEQIVISTEKLEMEIKGFDKVVAAERLLNKADEIDINYDEETLLFDVIEAFEEIENLILLEDIDITEFDEIGKDIDKSNRRIAMLVSCLNANEQVNSLEKQLKESEGKLKNKIIDMKECYTCGSKITEKIAVKIVKEI